MGGEEGAVTGRGGREEGCGKGARWRMPDGRGGRVHAPVCGSLWSLCRRSRDSSRGVSRLSRKLTLKMQVKYAAVGKGFRARRFSGLLCRGSFSSWSLVKLDHL